MPEWQELLPVDLLPIDIGGPWPDRPRIGGLYGGSLGLVLAGLLPSDRPSLVLHADAGSKSDLAGDLALFGIARERRLAFPDLDDDERGLERRAVLQRLRQGGAPVVLASLLAATQPVPLRGAMERDAIQLVAGSEDWGPERLAERLARDEWERVSLVTQPGEFSVRGDIATTRCGWSTSVTSWKDCALSTWSRNARPTS